MKRWNKPGSRAAHERMAQLRQRKLKYQQAALASDWSLATGREPREWWTEARAAGLAPGCGTQACIDFLIQAIAQAKQVA
jgi:hypothetical protein